MISHSTHERVRDSYQLDAGVFTRIRTLLLAAAGIGWLACLIGWFTNSTQFFHSYLLGYTFSTTIILGALFFTMIQYLTGSAWSVPVRRFMETTISLLPYAAVLFIPVALGISSIYVWSDPKVVMADHVLRQKAGYLTPTWFIIRSMVYLAIWSFWGVRLYRNSLDQDRTKSLENMHIASFWSAPGLLVAAAGRPFPRAADAFIKLARARNWEPVDAVA